jgi:hypothetical protein
MNITQLTSNWLSKEMLYLTLNFIYSVILYLALPGLLRQKLHLTRRWLFLLAN